MTTDKLIADARKIGDELADENLDYASGLMYRLIYTIERQQKDIDALRGFANAIMLDFPDVGCLDGGDIQELALKHGLLEKIQRNEPCGDHCSCADFGSNFPTDCYMTTTLLSGERNET